MSLDRTSFQKCTTFKSSTRRSLKRVDSDKAFNSEPSFELLRGIEEAI